MASVSQEPEIIFAQKLASNEKTIRNKTLSKLRKYIRVRSEKVEGGFTEDELLKIWKGLFYCLWMQDMPLLQEELSTKISGFLDSFRTTDSQFLYFKTFLQTIKREWNNIDRLRMDKFFQLVRFVFRRVFEMLGRTKWESRLVNEFLEVFSAQLLQSSAAAPAGLVLHVLDLYMTELALVGSAELTAEQNQTFIDPFCKAMAKTKDRVLLNAIGSNIFDAIVDQVPFAIEDLMKEIYQGRGEELDSSNEELNAENSQKTKDAKNNVTISDLEDDCDDLEEDEFLLPEDVKTDDSKCGPVLQFDYGALADRLFDLASHSNVPGFNRSKIYKFVKIFRDLCEGVFPQNDVEDVSTDEDDECQKRRRKKRRNRDQTKKQSSAKKSRAALKDSETEAAESGDTAAAQDLKKMKKKKIKKKCLKSVDEWSASDVQPMNVDEPKPESRIEAGTIEDFSNLSQSREGDIQETLPPIEVSTEDKIVHASKPQKKIHKKKKAKYLEEGKVTAESWDSLDTDASEHQPANIITPLLLKKKKLKNKRSLTDIDSGENITCETKHIVERAEESSAIASVVKPPKKQRKLKKASTEKMKQPDSQKNGSELHEPQENKKQEIVPLDGQEPKVSKKFCQEPETVCKYVSQSSPKQSVSCFTPVKSQRDRKQTQQQPAENCLSLAQRAEEHADASAENMKTKKRKQTSELIETADIEVNGASSPAGQNKRRRKRRVMENVETAQINGHTKMTSVKRQKISANLLTPKSEMKKVTFGLKNNKTMEFRKMDQSLLVSPAGRSRVVFDPKRTPKFGVLKPVTSAPASSMRNGTITGKRAIAADFF